MCPFFCVLNTNQYQSYISSNMYIDDNDVVIVVIDLSKIKISSMQLLDELILFG
jgi:hypothetical protein